jgi:hypothetical protein
VVDEVSFVQEQKTEVHILRVAGLYVGFLVCNDRELAVLEDWAYGEV